MSLRVNRYIHGDCPGCKGKLAKHLGNGDFQCRSVGCGKVFSGERHQATRLNPVNAKRRRESRAACFGALADFVRALGCCVEACGERRAVDPHHVVTRGAGGQAWRVESDGSFVGNIVPLCRLHHDEVGTRGAKTFEENRQFVFRMGSNRPVFTDTLCKLAIHVGKVASRAGIDPRSNTKGAVQ